MVESRSLSLGSLARLQPLLDHSKMGRCKIQLTLISSESSVSHFRYSKLVEAQGPDLLWVRRDREESDRLLVAPFAYLISANTPLAMVSPKTHSSSEIPDQVEVGLANQVRSTRSFKK